MPSADAATTAKAELRVVLRARRQARPAADREVRGAAVSRALLDALAGVTVVAGYVPDESEPDIGAFLDAFPGQVLLPVVTGDDLRWAVSDGRLAPGRFGLLEPVGPRLPPSALGTAGVVVVPALAVDRRGVRLGRGRGYYDRALAHAAADAVLVAVVHDEELLEAVPAEAHDRRVHAVVTPSDGWRDLPPPG